MGTIGNVDQADSNGEIQEENLEGDQINATTAQKEDATVKEGEKADKTQEKEIKSAPKEGDATAKEVKNADETQDEEKKSPPKEGDSKSKEGEKADNTKEKKT